MEDRLIAIQEALDQVAQQQIKYGEDLLQTQDDLEQFKVDFMTNYVGTPAASYDSLEKISRVLEALDLKHFAFFNIQTELLNNLTINQIIENGEELYNKFYNEFKKGKILYIYDGFNFVMLNNFTTHPPLGYFTGIVYQLNEEEILNLTNDQDILNAININHKHLAIIYNFDSKKMYIKNFN